MSTAPLLEDELCVMGTPVYHISWFIIRTRTLLLASPTADSALQHHTRDLLWRGGEADFDFVLHDIHSSAGADKREIVDYAFLAARPQPPRSSAQSPAERQAQLKKWMEECLLAYNDIHFEDLLRDASTTLYFEYDAFLKDIGGGGGGAAETAGVEKKLRRVRGLVLPSLDGSGGTLVHFTIPLLLTHAEKVYQALNNVAVLYCKFAHHVWRAGYQVCAVEADLQVRIRVQPKTGKLTALSEDVTMRIDDRADSRAGESLVPFLKSCVDLHGLPKLTLSSQGCGFIDFLPQLDDVLYRRIREPLHFVKLVLGLVADFGSPIELSVSRKALSGADAPQASPARKTAVFCVVDGATSIAFSIGLHYHDGQELPSIETTCMQYLDPQHETPLSLKVRYPKTGVAMRKDDDGFVDVEELRVAVVHGVMECMAQSMAMA